MRLVHNFSTLAVLFSLANAALYPTNPVESTVFSAGANEILTWSDDTNEPRVNELSQLTVELLVNDHVSAFALVRIGLSSHNASHAAFRLQFVSTLATNINPMDYAAMVNIPAYVGVDGSS